MAEVYGHEPQYRTVRQLSFGGGVVDADAPTRIQDNESPSALNIEFDRDTLATTRGCRKWNNQIAPAAAIRTRPDPSFAPLYIEAGMSVPLRGYGYLPYSADTDICGDHHED